MLQDELRNISEVVTQLREHPEPPLPSLFVPFRFTRLLGSAMLTLFSADPTDTNVRQTEASLEVTRQERMGCLQRRTRIYGRRRSRSCSSIREKLLSRSSR